MTDKDDQQQFSLNILASTLTGSLVISITNPLDCLKQRWQIAPTQKPLPVGTTLLQFSSGLVRSEGVLRGLWLPGLATNAMACSISVGTRLGFYPWLRKMFSSSNGTKSSTSMFAAGLCGGAIGYIFAAPFFHASRVAQCQMQRAEVAKVDVGLGALRNLGQGGVRHLWRGADVLVARGALMSATQLAAYDSIKSISVGGNLVQDGPVLHCFCSFFASICCTTAICPLDCLLTRYQGSQQGSFSSPLACMRHMVHSEGLGVFFRGWLPLWSRFLPSSVMTFYIYEQLRYYVLGGYLN